MQVRKSNTGHFQDLTKYYIHGLVFSKPKQRKNSLVSFHQLKWMYLFLIREKDMCHENSTESAWQPHVPNSISKKSLSILWITFSCKNSFKLAYSRWTTSLCKNRQSDVNGYNDPYELFLIIIFKMIQQLYRSYTMNPLTYSQCVLEIWAPPVLIRHPMNLPFVLQNCKRRT